jgi:hypothetical protein
MNIIQDSINSQAPFLTEHQIDFDKLNNITLNQKLDSIFNNLIYNNLDIRLIPNIYDSKNLLILFDYFFNKLNDIVTEPNISEKRNDIFKYLSDILINNIQNISDKKDQEKISQFFYNLNFFEIFLGTLNNKDISVFKEKFSLFIKVSLNFFK